MVKYKCKVCKVVFEAPAGEEAVCPVCKVKGDKLEVIEEPANPYVGTQTEKNLEAAFAGESQARNKYTYFASVAKKEGYEQISALFQKTADNEFYVKLRFLWQFEAILLLKCCIPAMQLLNCCRIVVG